MEQYGNEKMILGADTRDGYISVNGWKEESTQQLLPYLGQYIKLGVKNVLCTDIHKDGMLQGPSIELYKEIMSNYPELHLIASGGVSSLDDIHQLNDAGIPAVVFGKALYEGRFTLKELVTSFS